MAVTDRHHHRVVSCSRIGVVAAAIAGGLVLAGAATAAVPAYADPAPAVVPAAVPAAESPEPAEDVAETVDAKEDVDE